MTPTHNLLFEIVHRGVLPRGHKLRITSLSDLGLMNALECKEPIDWPTLIIKCLARIVDPQSGSHQLEFGNLLRKVFTVFDVSLEEG